MMTKNELECFGILPSNRSDGKLELQLRCLVRAFRLLAHHNIPHPDVVSLVFEGKLFEEGNSFNPDMQQTLLHTLDRYPRQVFRPISAGGGEGVELPGLTKCIEGVRAAAAHFPFCPCIGWDFVLTKNGFCILETNTLPSLIVMQVHMQLLKNARNRRFFGRWGMVPGKPEIE